MREKTFRFSEPVNITELGINVPEKGVICRTEFCHPISVEDDDCLSAVFENGKVVVYFNGEEVPARYTVQDLK